MDFFYSEEIKQLIMAILFGTAIGVERELARKDASIRTFSLIAVGSCLFAILSLQVAHSAKIADPARLAAQVVSGIGFLGAGVIFRSPRGITGLTTAALMWVTSAIGLSAGFGRLDLAAFTTLGVLIIMFSFRLLHRLFGKYRFNGENN